MVRNNLLGGNQTTEEKIAKVNAMSISELLAVQESFILAMIREVAGTTNGRWYIKKNRRKGNDWNSEIEALSETNGRVFVFVYVQGGSTDTTHVEYFSEFFRNRDWRASLDIANVTYDAKEKAEVMRAFLLDYIYWDEIDREEREKAQAHKAKVDEITEVCDKNWRDSRYRNFGAWNCSRRNQECWSNGNKAFNEYLNEHTDELYAMGLEKASAVLKEVYLKNAVC